MNRHFVLRPYAASDFEAAFQLDQDCFGPDYRFSRAAMQRFITSRRARTTVAEDDGVLVGVCLGHIEGATGGPIGYVVTLDVAPPYRRFGLGAQLLNSFEQQARREGCRELLLHVAVGNAEAIRFYESQGWTRVHTVEAFYGSGLDALVYRKAAS